MTIKDVRRIARIERRRKLEAAINGSAYQKDLYARERIQDKFMTEVLCFGSAISNYEANERRVQIIFYKLMHAKMKQKWWVKWLNTPVRLI